jgi:hypothetical protein
MTSSILPIVDDGKINSFFVKANQFLYTHCKIEFELSTNKEEVLTSLWKTKFKATLEKNNNYFDKIIFESDTDLSMFMMRFG